MKYSDLIQFDPIETVVQLNEAVKEDQALRLVQTFVISDRMGEQLVNVIFQQLQFQVPADNKGLLVVGNYGTGKSHQLAVISAVAEKAELAEQLTNPAVAEAAKSIAGQFVVIRAEINSSMSLRQFVLETLQVALAGQGVHFEIPPEDQIRNHKDVFASMMAEFTKVFPDKGLLFVLDELLDYLRSNREQELMRNLNFLRAVGEFCKGSRFRFIGGVQESLFDNAHFQFAADSLRRVKDRFEQMRIAREDVAYVVSQRLLKKDAKQQALVREHLQGFTALYGTMNERMEEFVRLYPVHPAYLDTFERVYAAEKREVLKTLSRAIRGLLEQEVPQDDPGLLSYDSYWQTLKDNPSFRSVPDIREVIEKSDVLEARIQQAFTRPQYKSAALRIIHGLSVHRLTTADIFTPIGATAEVLRDDLCLLLPLPERDADFLKSTVETVLREILKTVSGQFLSYNPENGQYFLDLKKNIDFDSLIEKKAEVLDNEKLDEYYFDALRRVILEEPDAQAYVTGYRIWEHELEWREHRAGRSGYLFFGAPNERSTAQPPRDFYLYFLQPFSPPYYKEERKADEVFFRLKQRDEVLEKAVKLYAGARELALTASGSNKKIYEDKALQQLRTLTQWLQQNLATCCEVTHQGTGQLLGERLKAAHARSGERSGVKDAVDAAAASCLAACFEDLAPDYPVFTTPITRENREQAAQDGLRWIAGSVKGKLGTAVVDALELLDGDQLRPRDSRYAKHVLKQLSAKGEGQVLNRSELVKEEAGIEYWSRFRLEPEFLAVVLASLVHSGDLVLSITGKKIDASEINLFSSLPIKELVQFKHVERPRDLPLGALQELFELVGLPQGLIANAAKREEAVTQLQGKVSNLVEKVVTAQSQLGDLVLWGRSLLSEQEQGEWRSSLQSLQRFLESLQPFNTAGKLKTFPHDATTIQAQKGSLELAKELGELRNLVQQVGPITAYLGTAEAVLPSDDAWVQGIAEQKGELLAKITSPKHRADGSFQRQLGQRLAELKTAYQDNYLSRHGKARLNQTDDQRKVRLGQDPRLRQLQQLKKVEMMPAQQLRDFEETLFNLKPCYLLGRTDLETDPVCPHCHYKPVEEAAPPASPSQLISELDDRLDNLVTDWSERVLSNLEDPTVAANINLVTDSKGKSALEELISQKALPEPIEAPLLKALQEVLQGLEKVVLTEEQLRAALTSGGLPCTVEELKDRFADYLSERTKGKEIAKVLIVLE